MDCLCVHTDWLRAGPVRPFGIPRGCCRAAYTALCVVTWPSCVCVCVCVSRVCVCVCRVCVCVCVSYLEHRCDESSIRHSHSQGHVDVLRVCDAVTVRGHSCVTHTHTHISPMDMPVLPTLTVLACAAEVRLCVFLCGLSCILEYVSVPSLLACALLAHYCVVADSCEALAYPTGVWRMADPNTHPRTSWGAERGPHPQPWRGGQSWSHPTHTHTHTRKVAGTPCLQLSVARGTRAWRTA